MLVNICGGVHSINGDTLACELKNIGFFRNIYTCSVTALENPSDNKIITGHNGVHKANQNDRDVKQIHIHETNTKYIPDLGVLSHLTTLIVHNSNLIEIKAENFLGMQELQSLDLYDNKLSSFPSDTFSTLTKLKYLSLSDNQIEVIPSNLFNLFIF